MKLHEFISETLSQIIQGVSEAQESDVVTATKSAIVPSGQTMEDDAIRNQQVQFDIAVTTESGKESKGGIGVFVGPVTLGSTGTSEQTTGSINRIQFSVPIYLPSQRFRRNK